MPSKAEIEAAAIAIVKQAASGVDLSALEPDLLANMRPDQREDLLAKAMAALEAAERVRASEQR